MAESAGHAPGHEISGDGYAVSQRFRMGEVKGTMAGDNFGVGSLPGTQTSRRQGTGDDATILKDSERSGPPAISQGKGQMSATSHSYHGPHQHD